MFLKMPQRGSWSRALGTKAPKGRTRSTRSRQTEKTLRHQSTQLCAQTPPPGQPIVRWPAGDHPCHLNGGQTDAVRFAGLPSRSQPHKEPWACAPGSHCAGVHRWQQSRSAISRDVSCCRRPVLRPLGYEPRRHRSTLADNQRDTPAFSQLRWGGAAPTCRGSCREGPSLETAVVGADRLRHRIGHCEQRFLTTETTTTRLSKSNLSRRGYLLSLAGPVCRSDLLPTPAVPPNCSTDSGITLVRCAFQRQSVMQSAGIPCSSRRSGDGQAILRSIQTDPDS